MVVPIYVIKENLILVLYLQTPVESEHDTAPNSMAEQCGQLRHGTSPYSNISLTSSELTPQIF